MADLPDWELPPKHLLTRMFTPEMIQTLILFSTEVDKTVTHFNDILLRAAQEHTAIPLHSRWPQSMHDLLDGLSQVLSEDTRRKLIANAKWFDEVAGTDGLCDSLIQTKSFASWLRLQGEHLYDAARRAADKSATRLAQEKDEGGCVGYKGRVRAFSRRLRNGVSRCFKMGWMRRTKRSAVVE